MARGGRRAGKPGKSYSNRSDLNEHQPVATPPSQVYGDATRLREAQQAMPLPNNRPAPGRIMSRPGGGPMVEPGGLYAPTSRAAEPVQAGLPIGPGGGPDFAGVSDEDLLEAIARRFPTSGIHRLLGRD